MALIIKGKFKLIIENKHGVTDFERDYKHAMFLF